MLEGKELLEKAKLLRSWGRSSSLFDDSEAIEERFKVSLEGIEYDAKFVFEEIGYQLEPSEISAAFALVQFEKLSQNVQSRQSNFDLHHSFLSQFKEFFDLPIQNPNADTGWLAFPMIVKDESPFSRTDLQIFLEKRNIQTRVVFTGNILKQPGFKKIKKKVNINGYPEADKVMRYGVLLACHHGLTNKMTKHIHKTVEDFIKSKII